VVSRRKSAANGGDVGHGWTRQLAGVDEHHRRAFVERREQRILAFFAEIGAGVIGQQHDTIGVQVVERPNRFGDCLVDVGQRPPCSMTTGAPLPASATKIGLPATVTVCSANVVVLMRWPRFWRRWKTRSPLVAAARSGRIRLRHR
jgi:hypothetical protein